MSVLTRFGAVACLLCLLGLGAAGMAAAQSANAIQPAAAGPVLPESETIRARVDEVNVVFTVTDARGKFVSNLSLDDLNVLDNQRAPERISYFQQQSELPLRVGLLVDLSASITEKFNYEKNAAIAFLKKVLRPQVDEAFVVGFASQVVLFQDFTSDIAALSRAVQKMRVGGDTRLYDAVQFAAGKLSNSSGPMLMRRAIIIITDGEDTRSRALMYDAIQSALRAETVVFALSSNDLGRHEYPRGEAVLELITRPTGGGVLAAHSKPEIAHAFGQVKETLRNQYAVGYKPAGFKPDGTFHTIEIVPRLKPLRVRCRRGYFAPREDQARAADATGP